MVDPLVCAKVTAKQADKQTARNMATQGSSDIAARKSENLILLFACAK